jgi:hypothetical protein
VKNEPKYAPWHEQSGERWLRLLHEADAVRVKYKGQGQGRPGLGDPDLLDVELSSYPSTRMGFVSATTATPAAMDRRTSSASLSPGGSARGCSSWSRRST